MKIKIACVISQLNFGGAQTMLIRLIKGIDTSKFEIKLFVCGEKLDNSLEQEIDRENIEVEYLYLKEKNGVLINSLNKFINYKKFTKELKKYNADIIHDHLDNIYSFVYCIMNKKKLIFTIHSWPDRLNTKKMRFFIKKLFKANNLELVGVAEVIANRSAEIFPCSKEIITTIYNPVDIGKYDKITVKSKVFNYIHIGRLTPIKNQMLLLDAFAKVVNKKPCSCLTIVGDGILRKELEEHARKLCISEKVMFLGERSDIPELLSKADVFVLTSNSEAFPMTVLEAMASKQPVVATNVGGILEQVGTDILLAEPRDIESIYEKLLIVQESEEIYNKVVEIQNDRIKQFAIDKVCKDYEDTYEKFLGYRS